MGLTVTPQRASPRTRASVLDALKVLAVRGQFHPRDEKFGLSLARCKHLTIAQEDAAVGMLQRYRRPLLAVGLVPEQLARHARQREFKDTPQWVRNLGQPSRAIGFSKTGMFAIRFDHDATVVRAMHRIPDRKWHEEHLLWSVPLARCLEVEKFAAKHAFVLSPAAREAINAYREKALAEQRQEQLDIAASQATDSDIELPVTELFAFQRAGVAYILDRKRTFIGDEPGCIDGGATIRVNRGGKGFAVRLADAHDRFHGQGPHRWEPKIPTYARALVNGELRQHRVLDILSRGQRPTVEITFATGKTLICTPDHEIARPDGAWTAAYELDPGDVVIGNGATGCPLCGSDENLVTYRYAKFRGYCRNCVYRVMRAKPTWKGGRSRDSDGYIVVSGQHGHPRDHGKGQVYEHILVVEQALGRHLEWPDEHVHHKNEVKDDNRFENLEVLRHGEHMIEHDCYQRLSHDRWGNQTFTPTADVVVSVAPAGDRHVYDLVMEAPHHNFVADGIVVHNCGKTRTVLTAFEAQHLRTGDVYPALIIPPKSVFGAWRNEYASLLPHRRVVTLTSQSLGPANGALFQGATADVYLTNYDIVAKLLDRLTALGLRSLALDESHACRNPESARTRAIQKLADGLPGDPMILMMSGTAIVNRPAELIPQLAIMRRLDEFGGASDFRAKYCKGRTKAQNLTTLNRELRKRCLVRRLKKDVLKQLPAKRWADLPVELTNRAEYRRAEENFMEWLETTNPAAMSSAERAEALAQMTALRRLAAAGKIAHMVEWVKDTLDSVEKLIVFAHHRAEQQRLIADLSRFKPVAILGGDSDESRTAAQESFQTDPATRLIVCSLRGASLGITLTAASDVGFLELDWTPAGMTQAIDRCVADDQLVHVEGQGLTYIQDVEVGDRVLDQHGEWSEVTDSVRRVVQHHPMTAITYRRWNQPLRTTYDHLLLVKRGDSPPAWMKAHTVLPGDLLVMPRPRATAPIPNLVPPEACRGSAYMRTTERILDETAIAEIRARYGSRNRGGVSGRRLAQQYGVSPPTIQRAVHDRPPGGRQRNAKHVPLPGRIPLTNRILKLIGWYLAEGFASVDDRKGQFVSLSGHVKELPILEVMRQILMEDLHVRTVTIAEPRKNAIELRAYSPELARWWHGWLGADSYTKQLPSELLALPPDRLAVLLESYIDGDGYRRKAQHEWVTASYGLASQIALAALRCGHAATLRRVESGKNAGQWIGGYTENGAPSSPLLAMWDDDYVYNPVTVVETRNTPHEYVNDLTVEGGHSFTVGMSVVHNCHRIGATDSVTGWRMIGPSTIDEYMLALLVTKQKIMDQVLDGTSASEVSSAGIQSDLVDVYRQRAKDRSG